MKALLVEDDEALAELLEAALTSQHYQVDRATDGPSGWELAASFEYDLILLDVMLPQLGGIRFCQQLRAQGDRTPILLMTAQDSTTQKVTGLDAGADDYVIKPFETEELLARIRALLRRGNPTSSPVLEWENLRLDPSICEVTCNGQPLRLSAKAYELLELFLRNPHRIFSPSALIEHLWAFEEIPLENTVRTHIKLLRQQLKRAKAGDMIETIYGLGYRLKTTEATNETPTTTEAENKTPITTATANKPPTTAATPDNVSAPQPGPTVAPNQSPKSPNMTAIWQRSKAKYLNRILILEQIVVSLQDGPDDPVLRQQAQQEVHTLKGSLGSFGFTHASHICQQIEQMLRAQASFSQTQIESLSQLISTLRQDLEQPPGSSLAPSTSETGMVPLNSHLLIVADNAQWVEKLTAEAMNWGMQARCMNDLATVKAEIAHTHPDAILLDLSWSDSAENGLELLAEVAIAHPSIPVVILTAQASLANRVRVARLGGQAFLHKPVSPARILAAITQALQHAHPPEAKLMIVDDDAQLLDFLRTLLGPWGFQLTLLNDPQQFWQTLEQCIPDLLILDIEMPELSGIDLCQVVRQAPSWSDLPILFMSSHTDIETIQQVFTVGADDYVNKPILGPELIARILNRLERARILHKLAKIKGRLT
ncbi:MAG: response regulator [Cyanothece sp. SIO1E1]|nr:response regulator [Cyanothece sp. SIO1E1]